MATAQIDSRLRTPSEIVLYLEDEPLIGVTAAAGVLGIKAPNFRRDAAPHLTEVPVEGSASVYFRSQVQALAEERARKRAAADG